MTETANPTTTSRRSLDRWLTVWNSDGDLARETGGVDVFDYDADGRVRRFRSVGGSGACAADRRDQRRRVCQAGGTKRAERQ